MAMFGEDEDVGPFVMAEDGEEWFPFSLDNLEEMEAEQNSLARTTKQESADYGQTDSDNDADVTSRGTGASGPGPPDLRQAGNDSGAGGGAGRVSASKRARSGESKSSRGTLHRGAGGIGAGRGGTGGGVGGARGGDGVPSAVDAAKRACFAGIRESSVLPSKGRPDKNKGERKEVRDASQEQRRIQQTVATELQAPAKRTGNSSRACPSESKTKHRGAGVLAGGVEGVPSRREPAPWSTPAGAGESGSGRGGRSRHKSSTSSTTSTSLTTASCTTSDGGGFGGSDGGDGDGAGKGSSVQNRRRLERNAREQKRSLKISQRIEDLRRMLSQFGVDVKTSKSAVLSEATDYIAHLQRQQAHAEAERARLLQLLHQANQRAAAAGALSTPLLAAGGVSVGVAIPPATPTVASREGVGELGGSVCDAAASNSSVAVEGRAAASMVDTKSKEGNGASSVATTSAVSSTTVCPASDRATEDTLKPSNRGMVSTSCSGAAAGTPSVIVKPEAKESLFPGSSDAAGPLAYGDDTCSPWESHQKEPHLQQQQQQQQWQQQQQQQPHSAARESVRRTEACSTAGNIASTQMSQASTFATRLLQTRVQPTPTARGQISLTRSGAGVMPPGFMLPGGTMRPGPVTGGAIHQMATAGGVGIGGNLAGGFGMVGAPLELATARALSHVNYERVFRTASVPMAIANLNGNLVDCNARLTEVTGFWREEVLFMTIFDLVADPLLQHTLSMISSILSLRGVASPPFFQVLGKRRDGSPGGVVQITVAQDEAFRPIHFSICILDCATGGFVMGNA